MTGTWAGADTTEAGLTTARPGTGDWAGEWAAEDWAGEWPGDRPGEPATGNRTGDQADDQAGDQADDQADGRAGGPADGPAGGLVDPPGTGAGVGADMWAPLTLEAFHTGNVRAWLRYAHLHLGDRALVETTVEAAFRHLALLWPRVLRQENVEAYAWSVLKEHVAECLNRRQRPAALVETAAFDSAVRRLLRESRRQFEILESTIGLYTAIARLPERQYDAFVLHCVLGYSDQHVARLLGSLPSTVRSNVRWAKRRIARDLGLATSGG